MRLSLTLILLIAFVATHGQAPSFKKELAKIDPYIQQLMTEWEVAGSAVSIVYKDKVIFHICSNAKLFHILKVLNDLR
jgi:hypothetical protein